MTRRSLTLALACVALLLLPALVQAAQAVATFADGKGSLIHDYQSSSLPPIITDNRVTDVVDAFGGMAGGNWDAGWEYHISTSSIDASYTALGFGDVNYNPVLDDNYLSIKSTIINNNSGRSTGVVRAYGAGINAAADHTIQFTIRIDEDVTAANFSTSNDRYDIHDRADYEYVSSTGALLTESLAYGATYSTWGISLRGGWTDTSMNDHWVITSYDLDTATTSYFDTGITPVQGSPYTFTLDFDMEDGLNGTYGVEISSGGFLMFSSALFGQRYGMSRATNDDVNGPYDRETTGRLLFSASGMKDSGEGYNHRDWSIDGVTISGEAAITTPLPGDTDNDGDVDDNDAAMLASHWLQTELTGGYEVGDFNTDGTVDDRDAAILAAHWVRGTGGEGAGTVPEPGTFVLLGLGALMLVVRRFRG